jgi:nicotinate-nucleotide adenylyltransferase
LSPGCATGVFGGTFDPVLRGLVALAEHALRELELECVLCVPCAIPPHKHPLQLAVASHRLAMLELALADRTPLVASELELTRGGVSFTIDTLSELQRDSPASILVFIMGMDSLVDLPTWKEFREILDRFDLVVVDRDRLDSRSVRERLHPDVASRLRSGSWTARPRNDTHGIYHLGMDRVPVSSRRIRERVARGESLDDLVPPAVARYIQEQRLYA